MVDGGWEYKVLERRMGKTKKISKMDKADQSYKSLSHSASPARSQTPKRLVGW